MCTCRADPCVAQLRGTAIANAVTLEQRCSTCVPPGPAICRYRPVSLTDLHAFVEAYFVPIQLALAMLGMGATLTVQDFIDVVRDPRGLALGWALQLVFVPLAAFAFVELLELEPGWAVGLCLVAVVPGGTFSNLLTFLGRGNLALSISDSSSCGTARRARRASRLPGSMTRNPAPTR